MRCLKNRKVITFGVSKRKFSVRRENPLLERCLMQVVNVKTAFVKYF